MRRSVATVALLLIAAAAVAQTEYETLRQPALRRLVARMQANQIDAARGDLADYVARFPGDATMQYNLACLDALSGAPEAALVHLDAAIAAGYRELDQVLTDPDLISLAHDPRVTGRLAAARAARVERMREAGFLLVEGTWSEPLPLVPDPCGPGAGAVDGSVRFRYDRDALTCEVTPPAGGADEIVVVVSLPADLDHDETDRWFEFRADPVAPGPVPRTGRHGRAEVVPAAAVLGRAGAVTTVTVPWSSLRPYRPPVELLFGLNVVVRRRAADGPGARWELVRDPYAASDFQTWRRFAPATLDPGPAPAPVVAGRLDTYLVVGDSLSVELGIQGCAGGPTRLALWTAPDSGAGKVDTTFTTALEADLAYLTVDYVLSDLPSGWFTVGAEITTASGDTLAWHDRGFRLSPDWFLAQRGREQTLSAPERSIVDYQLFRALRSQQNFRPHDDPADIAEAALAVAALLDRAEATGSVLPAGPCVTEAAFPSGKDALQACRLVLPAAQWRQSGTVVLVLTPDHVAATALADALSAGRAADDQRIFVVVPAPQSAGQPAAAGLAAAARDWITELLAPRTLRLVGVGAAAEVALHGLVGEPGGWDAVLLLVGATFDPWVLGQPEATGRSLAAGLDSTPVVVSLPADATARARALLETLRKDVTGMRVEARETGEDGAAAWSARILAPVDQPGSRSGSP